MHCRHMHICALTQTTPWCFLFLLFLTHVLPVCKKDPSTSALMTRKKDGSSHIVFHTAFIPLRRVVPFRGTLSCAFGAELLYSYAPHRLPTDPITPIEPASPLSSNQGAARPGANLEPIHTKQKTPAIKTGAFACHSRISKTIRNDSRPGCTTGSTGYHCPSDSDSRRPKSMCCFLLLRRGERGRHFHRCRRRRYPLHHRG